MIAAVFSIMSYVVMILPLMIFSRFMYKKFKLAESKVITIDEVKGEEKEA